MIFRPLPGRFGGRRRPVAVLVVLVASAATAVTPAHAMPPSGASPAPAVVVGSPVVRSSTAGAELTPLGAVANFVAARTRDGFTRLLSPAPVPRGADPHAPLPPDGTFVRDGAGHVYRVVGRSLIHVLSWAPFGGPHATRPLTAAMIRRLPDHPADGTLVTALPEKVVHQFVGGAPLVVTTWKALGGRALPTIAVEGRSLDAAGRCNPRFPHALPWCFVRDVPRTERVTTDARGYRVLDFDVGRFIRTAQDGRVYRLVGGAPVYVSSWAPFGGPRPTLTVDAVTVARAGGEGRWSHLRWFPYELTYLRDGATGETYTVGGEAPLYLDDPDVLRDDVAEVTITAGTIDGAATRHWTEGARWQHLRPRPVDRTILMALPDRSTYWVKSGFPDPHPISLQQIVENGIQPPYYFAVVGRATIDRAGTGGKWDHLSGTPDPGAG